MFEFLAENLATILVGAPVFGILAAVMIKLVRDHKNHRTSCSCGCGGCPGSDICHHD